MNDLERHLLRVGVTRTLVFVMAFIAFLTLAARTF